MHVYGLDSTLFWRSIGSGNSAAEARRKCPNVQLVYVATIAPGETVPRYHDNVSLQHKVHYSLASICLAPKLHSVVDSLHGCPVAVQVSLDVYRQASAAIMQVMQGHAGVFERGGLDEAYLDVTEHWYGLPSLPAV